jgi:mevalonate kinase
MDPVKKELHACGKLLVTGEYLILRGARGLALPTSKGQHFKASSRQEKGFSWTSLDHLGKNWFKADLNANFDFIGSPSNADIGQRLQSILKAAISLNDDILHSKGGFDIETRLEFPRDWGLGSSSTLIYALASWFNVDALELSERSLGGSGYDVAVSMHDTPIIYQRGTHGIEHKSIAFNPTFQDNLFFIHLGQKQDSRKEVADFKSIEVTPSQITQMDAITNEVATTNKLERFEELIKLHEVLMEGILGRESASSRFCEYKAGVVKYLGGWGGDFLLATGAQGDLEFFRSHGLKIIIPYADMIKQ